MKKYLIFLIIILLSLSACGSETNDNSSSEVEVKEKEYLSTGTFEIYDEDNNLIFTGSEGKVLLTTKVSYTIKYNGKCYYEDLIHYDEDQNIIWHYQETTYIVPISRSIGQELYIDEANTAYSTEETKYVELAYDLSENHIKDVSYQLTIYSKNFPLNYFTKDLETRTTAILSKGGGFHLSNTILFGTYPQTLVTDSDTIADLKALVKSSDYISYRYTYSTDYIETDCMQYQDISYNDELYRAVYIREYRPTTDNGDLSAYSTDGTLNEDGTKVKEYNYAWADTFEIGGVYFFKFEPIEWDYLEGDNSTITLFSSKILDSQSEYNYQDKLYGMNKFLDRETYKLSLSEPTEDMLSNSDYGYMAIKENDSARWKMLTDYAKIQGAASIEEGYAINNYFQLMDYGKYWFVDNTDNKKNKYQDSSYIDVSGYGMINAISNRWTNIGMAPVLKISKK